MGSMRQRSIQAADRMRLLSARAGRHGWRTARSVDMASAARNAPTTAEGSATGCPRRPSCFGDATFPERGRAEYGNDRLALHEWHVTRKHEGDLGVSESRHRGTKADLDRREHAAFGGRVQATVVVSSVATATADMPRTTNT